MYCIKCGKVLENDFRFCSGCGTVNPDYPFNGTPDGQAQPGNNNNSAQNNSGQPQMNSAQTCSPYMVQPDIGNEQDIPPVYNTAEGNEIAAYQQNTPADMGPEVSVRPAKSVKNVTAAIAVCTAALIAGVIGVTVLSTVFSVSKTNSQVRHNITINTENKEPDVYSFNALNNIREPEVIWETDDVRVSTRNIVHGGEYYSDAQLQLFVENKSDRNLRVRCEEFSVNGYEFNGSVFSSLPAEKKRVDSVYISLDEMERLGIENINAMTIAFSAEDSDTYEDIAESDVISIETKNDVKDDAFEPSQLLYDQNDIAIGYEGIEFDDSFGSANLYIYIENHSDEIITFSLDDVSINGRMINTNIYQNVYPGKACITNAYISKDVLKKNKINENDDIDEIEFTVKGSPKGKYDNILKNTDPLTVTNP